MPIVFNSSLVRVYVIEDGPSWIFPFILLIDDDEEGCVFHLYICSPFVLSFSKKKKCVASCFFFCCHRCYQNNQHTKSMLVDWFHFFLSIRHVLNIWYLFAWLEIRNHWKLNGFSHTCRSRLPFSILNASFEFWIVHQQFLDILHALIFIFQFQQFCHTRFDFDFFFIRSSNFTCTMLFWCNR